MGLPMLRPYLAGGNTEDFRYGANFAFAGATALNASFFEDKGFQFSPMEYFLGVHEILSNQTCYDRSATCIASRSPSVVLLASKHIGFPDCPCRDQVGI
ncbi:hypothetical protein BHM03_00036617 [Ensete ventricosum]|nr:hypothetical protein BHM03_00036617 [Ensete ventricosum]